MLRRQRRILRIWRHPAFAVVAAVFIGFAGLKPIREVAEMTRVARTNDPAQIADWRLDHMLTPSVAESAIRSALADGQIDAAKGIIELTARRNVAIDPALISKARREDANQGSLTNRAKRLVGGFVTGDSDDSYALAGAMLSDFCFVGDFRDLGREGMHYLSGQRYDPWVFGMAAGGVASTVATYAFAGAGAPERVGFSLLKSARRAGHLSPRLVAGIADAVAKSRGTTVLVKLGESLSVIEDHAGLSAALDALSIAETPEDVTLVSRLAIAKGRETLGILRLLGRGAYRVAKSGYELTTWLLWAVCSLLGFCAACKAAVERMMERHIVRQKLRRARAA